MSALSFWPRQTRVERCVLCHDSVRGSSLCAGCRADMQQVFTDAGALCPRCAKPSAGGTLCGRCQQKPPPFDAVWASAYYEAPLNSMLHALKYRADLSLLDALMEIMYAQPPHWLAHTPMDAVLAVPMSGKRRLERGFNQSDEMATALARHYGLPLFGRHTVYRHFTPPQSTLKQAERMKNLRHAFRIDSDVKNCKLLLIDDVCTTGATFYALARMLKRAGADAVYCWSLALTK